MITPEYCLLCGSKWRGGAAKPGNKLMPSTRVFYDCGVSMSYENLYVSLDKEEEGAVKVLIKNCLGDRIDNNEEFICGNCGRALPARWLYCSKECTREDEQKQLWNEENK